MPPQQNDAPTPGAPRWTLQVPAEPRSAAAVRAFVCERATDAGFAEEAVAEIEVAVGEAVTNAILYGHHLDRPNAPEATGEHIVVLVEVTPAAFAVEIQDAGPGFDPKRVQQTGREDTDALGGRGLYLMQALMDRVHLHYDGSGMNVRLERFRALAP